MDSDLSMGGVTKKFDYESRSLYSLTIIRCKAAEVYPDLIA